MNDEQPVPEMTKEEVAAARLEKYQKDPSLFLDTDDVVMAIIRGNTGVLGTFHGAAKRFEQECGLSRLTYKTNMIWQMMDMTAEMKKPSGIITSNGRVPRPGEAVHPPFDK